MKKLLLFMVGALMLLSVVSAVPQAGDTGVDTTYGSYDWIVCRADENTAWVSADNSGKYNAYSVCEGLGYSDVDAWGGTWGLVCDNEYYNGAGAQHGDPSLIKYTVHWRCTGYTGNNNGDVPEFSIVAGALVLAGAGLFVGLKRRK